MNATYASNVVSKIGNLFSKILLPIKKIIELEKKLVLSEQKLENERFAAIGELSARFTHDMRNPLSIIIVTLENIKIMYGTDDIKQKQFDKIDRSMDRITHQIDDVLNFVREQQLTLEKTKISEIIHESLDSITIPNDIKLIFPKNDIELICDKIKITTVVTNLILNSIQALKGEGMVALYIDENKDSIFFEIEDSGSGIPKDKLDDIFEPLFTTKQHGTGLGLASVKSIIESHGGSISVKSPPTIFTITLPKLQ